MIKKAICVSSEQRVILACHNRFYLVDCQELNAGPKQNKLWLTCEMLERRVKICMETMKGVDQWDVFV